MTTAAPSVARSSLTMLGGSVASRVLGVVRNGLITAIIGAQLAGDAFSLANTLPNVLYVLAAGGILNAVLIPSLARAMKLEDGGQEFTDRVITVALAGMALITVVVMAGAGGFVWLLARSSSPEFKDLALAFSLICLPQIFFYGLFALLGQILNARGQFGAFAWAPFIANVVAVAGLVLFLVVFPKPHRVGAERAPAPARPVRVDRADDLALRRLGDAVGRGPGPLARAGPAAHRVPLPAALGPAGCRARWRQPARPLGLRRPGGVTGRLLHQPGRPQQRHRLRPAARASRSAARGPVAYAIAFTLFMLPHAFITVSIITALFPRFSAAAASGDKDEPAPGLPHRSDDAARGQRADHGRGHRARQPDRRPAQPRDRHRAPSRSRPASSSS